MFLIEIIGLEPPCEKCNELLENAKEAVAASGVQAEVVKRWVLSEEVREKYGLPLSPALAINGVLVAQGRVYKTEQIITLLKG
ncbi:MAG: thioredoxin family protein [bacterium]